MLATGVARQRVVIAGGGVGGLTLALLLGRAGHDVTLVERDAFPVAPDVESAFDADRRGAPQVHQTHGFLARILVELRDHLPDVLEQLVAAGGTTMPMTAALGEPQPGDEDLKVLIVRRTTFEWVLRKAALAEPGLRFVTGAAVTGVLADRPDRPDQVGPPDAAQISTTGPGPVAGPKPGPAGGTPAPAGRASGPDVPTVAGVVLDTGATLPADVVVAACGRRGDVPGWLREAGVDVDESILESGLMYLTRWYRFVDGHNRELDPKLGGDLSYVKYLAVPGDAGTLSITLAIRPGDSELRRALSDGARFEEACRILPGPRQFFTAGPLEPLGGVRPMGGLLNRLRRFLDGDGRPTVLGFHAVGDAHTCTNPLYGRGCSLAVVQALALADAFAAHADDPAERAVAYERAVAHDVEPWFHSSVEMDRSGADPAATDGRGTGASGATGPARAMAAVFVAAATDPVIGRGVARLWNLLSLPTDLMTDPVLAGRIAEVMANPDAYPVPPPEGPTRAELLTLLAAVPTSGDGVTDDDVDDNDGDDVKEQSLA